MNQFNFFMYCKIVCNVCIDRISQPNILPNTRLLVVLLLLPLSCARTTFYAFQEGDGVSSLRVARQGLEVFGKQKVPLSHFLLFWDHFQEKLVPGNLETFEKLLIWGKSHQETVCVSVSSLGPVLICRQTDTTEIITKEYEVMIMLFLKEVKINVSLRFFSQNPQLFFLLTLPRNTLVKKWNITRVFWGWAPDWRSCCLSDPDTSDSPAPVLHPYL